MVDADNEGSAALLRSGRLAVWGLNCFGRMGQGHTADVLEPALVAFAACTEASDEAAASTADDQGECEIAAAAASTEDTEEEEETAGPVFSAEDAQEGYETAPSTADTEEEEGCTSGPVSSAEDAQDGFEPASSTADTEEEAVTAAVTFITAETDEHDEKAAVAPSTADTVDRDEPVAAAARDAGADKPAAASVPASASVGYGEPRIVAASLGSVYAAAVTEDGRLFAWGLGRHGNLGCGGRPGAKTRPVLVSGGALRGRRVVGVSCTRGQEGFKGGVASARGGGAEGPHTVAWTEAGELVTFGTCHKGLLCNLGSKEGAFKRPEWDELRPFLVGSAVRNGSRTPPLSPHAVWPPPYSAMGRVTAAVSAHIHCAAITEDGSLWAWGCGSNDGRCGVERFLAMNGEGQPPAVDSMKCYMMGPHRVGAVREQYWPFNRGLEGMAVIHAASGRNHMACIAVPAKDVVTPTK